MNIRPLQRDDRGELLRMQRLLWPATTPEEHEQDLSALLSGLWSRGEVGRVPGAVFVLEREGACSALGGFVEVSLRNVVDGCATTPVGYIEAWWVDEDLRRQGLGRKLVEAAEHWARSHGCREMGSDCLIENDLSLQAHSAMGYEVVDRCINFRKSLSDVTAPAITSDDWIDLTATPLSVSRAVEFVLDPRAGGVDVFLGTTRAETSEKHQPLLALDYESYPEMALRQLHDLAARAREKWPIIKLALLHRTGRVALGEPSVIIAVSTPHRADAFAACRWLIDTLKIEVAVWKKEIWRDGSGTWVHPAIDRPSESST